MGNPPHKPLVSKYADDEDIRELIPKFVGDLPRRVTTIKQLIAEGNSDGVRMIVHQLKGAGGGYGFDAITELAAKAEGPLKAGQTVEQVKAEIDALLELIRSVEGYDPARESAAAAPLTA